jgi:hypothetical protein
MADRKLFFEDVEIGDEIGPIEKVITDQQVLKFISLWGPAWAKKRNRFTDVRVAEAEGLPGRVLPGPMNFAILSQLLTDWSPTVILRKIDMVIRQVVPVNLPFELKGVVTDKVLTGGEGRVECDIFMENPHGERMVGAKSVVVLPTKG